jgi:hypothetical protein
LYKTKSKALPAALFLLALSCLSTTSIFNQQEQQNQALAQQYRTG